MYPAIRSTLASIGKVEYILNLPKKVTQMYSKISFTIYSTFVGYILNIVDFSNVPDLEYIWITFLGKFRMYNPPFPMEAKVDLIAGYIHNKPNIYPLGIL
jgi:hypothetical protein